MKHLIKTISLLLLLCGAVNVQAALRVVTTTEDLAAIAREIGGPAIEVESLTPSTRDPHFAEAKPSMIRKVYRADLLILIGADMEIGWLPPLLQSARNSRVQGGNSGFLDISTEIPLLGKMSGPVSRAMGDVHAKGNPHYWLDPRNGILMARAIAARLSELDHEHSADYQTRLASFEERLKQKIVDWQTSLAPLKGQAVIAYHTSFIYLADAFNFTIADEVEPKPGISPGASHLNHLVSRIKREKIGILIMEPYYEQRSSRYLNEQTDIQIAVLPQSVGARPDVKNYFDLFDRIVAILSEAQSKLKTGAQ
ncbi:MAG: zinc ABC transporter substrate-binding protein [Pseudomonadales bacterium]|nr:zinc ABC transporter substrate-binding protein [Pseudomonadales bacterium]